MTVELLNALDHSSACTSTHCTFAYCRYMQQLSKHFSTCTKFPCKICKDMSDLTEVHARNCFQCQCAVVKCSTFKHSLLLSHSDLEIKTKSPTSALKSLFRNGITEPKDNVDVMAMQNSLDFATASGSDLILLPRQITTSIKAQPLLLPKASTLTAAATCDTLLANQPNIQYESDRNVKTSSLSTSEKGLDLPLVSQQRTKKKRRKSVSLAKALQEARRIAVLEKRKELLHRRTIHCSASGIAPTTVAADDNAPTTGINVTALAARQSVMLGFGRHDSNSSFYSHSSSARVTDHDQHSGGEFNLTGSESEKQLSPSSISKCKRNFSKFSLESPTSSNLPRYLPWLIQVSPRDGQAAQRMTIVHPNPRYEPQRESESYPDPLLESIDLFQHDFVEDSLSLETSAEVSAP